MKKAKYIDEVIGGILFPLGFERVKSGGGDWKYEKEVINKKSEIVILQLVIYKHRYANMLSMQLYSTAAGRGSKELKDFPGYEKIPYGFIDYDNDEGFKQAINALGELLTDYGVAWFEEAVEPTHDDYLKVTDYRKLYLEHDQLADSFAERMNLIIQEISLRESFDIVAKVIADASEESFKETIPLFLETSAFIAKVVGNTHKYEWRLEDYYFKQWNCNLYVYNLNGVREENVMVLYKIMLAWCRKGDKNKGDVLIKRLVDLFHLPPNGSF